MVSLSDHTDSGYTPRHMRTTSPTNDAFDSSGCIKDPEAYEREMASTHAFNPPIGSRWYAGGEHWTVEKIQDHDGEPGVVLKLDRSNKKTRFARTLRWLEKHGIQKEDE